MTAEEFKKCLCDKGYPKPLIDAAIKFADGILNTEPLVGEDKQHYDNIKQVAAIGFIEGFGFCAEGVYPKIKDKL